MCSGKLLIDIKRGHFLNHPYKKNDMFLPSQVTRKIHPRKTNRNSIVTAILLVNITCSRKYFNVWFRDAVCYALGIVSDFLRTNCKWQLWHMEMMCLAVVVYLTSLLSTS